VISGNLSPTVRAMMLLQIRGWTETIWCSCDGLAFEEQIDYLLIIDRMER
jgi:hypothetical protein